MILCQVKNEASSYFSIFVCTKHARLLKTGSKVISRFEHTAVKMTSLGTPDMVKNARM